MEKTEREYILENQFHWEDRSMVAQLWNIAFRFSNYLFPHWLYLGQRKRFRHHSGVPMIAYGFLEKRVKILSLAGTMIRNSGNDRLEALEKEVLSTSILRISQVTVLILLLVTSSSYRQACLFHVYYIYLLKPKGHSHVGCWSFIILNDRTSKTDNRFCPKFMNK